MAKLFYTGTNGLSLLDYEFEIYNYWGKNQVSKTEFYVTEDFKVKISDDLKTFNPQQFTPAPNSEIFVAPKTPLCLEDIRKNYKVKREPDAGCCNVLHPAGVYYYWGAGNGTYVCDREKLAINLNGSNKTFAEILQENHPDLKESDFRVVRLTRDIYTASPVSDVYRKYLLGELKKPVISYTELPLKKENATTVDTLMLFYNAGSKEAKKENASTFYSVASALNQTDWKNYPGAISLVKTMLYNDRASIYRCVKRHPSYYPAPKSAKQVLEGNKYGEHTISYKDEADYKLAQGFIKEVLGLDKDVMFVNAFTLYKKLEEKNIQKEDFDILFNNCVKIVSRTYQQ